MMNEFRKKRDSLELFLKEQLIGPGAYNKKFHFQTDFDDDFYVESLRGKTAILNDKEILPETPAYQYSTAIIFPRTEITDSNQNDKYDDEGKIDNQSLGDENTSADDENFETDFSESLVSKQQNYPNQFGLSFVVTPDFQDKDLEATLSFRRYSKIPKMDYLEKGICVYIHENKKEIKRIINEYFDECFEVLTHNNNFFLKLKKEIEGQSFYDIDYIHLNNFIKKELIEELKKLLPIELDKEDGKGNKYYGVKSDSSKIIQLYRLGIENQGGKSFSDVIRLYDNSLIAYLKNLLIEDLDNYNNIKNSIRLLEIANQLKEMFNSFKGLYKRNSPTPLWQSSPHIVKITLPKYDKTKSNIQRFPNFEISKEFSGLSYAVQYLKDKKYNDKLFVKIIVSNNYQIKIAADEPKWLNKKDEANELSLFGIRLQILEMNENVLLEYNTPQVLEIDEEDSFNKILYRDFKNYGEGYNCSIDWGVNENGKRWVSTEFLPEQETPKVSFQPSKISEDKVVARLEDDEILSFRNLSTLSGLPDEWIIKGLNSFINEYKVWIEEKENDVEKEGENKSLLLKQIRACYADYNRLKRNINLLKDKQEAMVAFRLMNTAMFMQLHHGISLSNKSVEIKYKLTEEYYREIELKNEYKWRSFQLAFILLNIDGFVRPDAQLDYIKDVFETGWPERNEIADLVWFPTGGGKTEAYLGIIAFCIIFRRFTKKEKAYGTTVLMRYTLRLLTLQQFQRATLLICALEVIRKDNFNIPLNYSLGEERITIGLFVGAASLPNHWDQMLDELNRIKTQFPIKDGRKIKTNLPFNDCPWCGEDLFLNGELKNCKPNPNNPGSDSIGINDEFLIQCNNENCSFHSKGRIKPESSLPLRLFDEDIYKYPPTLLFGTVDKFAVLANNVSTNTNGRNNDSRRLFGKGYLNRGNERDYLPPELIIQDELHLLLGPLGTAVGLFEKVLDKNCTYKDENGAIVKPKIVTSTATTRNTDKQIFALFNRRGEIFPKQGIKADDSFFAYYERNPKGEYKSNRKYIGILPVGKTQVWMQLRVASIVLAHRIKYIKEHLSLQDVFSSPVSYKELKKVIDYYHTVLSYFNSLKEVGKTQSQLSHYLPGDVNYIVKNTIPWSFLNFLIRNSEEINYSELTGRLSGEEVKTNLAKNEVSFELLKITNERKYILNTIFPPEFVIATNMISVGLDVSRFNTMIISSMPRNIAEYIQASSRVARSKEGVVFTVHHPFRSRDLSHYQRFKEFHEKFYSYVEPISVTPFATKALDRYLPLYLAAYIRQEPSFELSNNMDAQQISEEVINKIKEKVVNDFTEIYSNAQKLDKYLKSDEKYGVKSSVAGIIGEDELNEVQEKLGQLLKDWLERKRELTESENLELFVYRDRENIKVSLFNMNTDNAYPNHWKVGFSLREIAPTTVVKTVQQ